MASMEQALCAYLMAKTEVTSIIGSGDGGRLYPNVLPQDYEVEQGAAATYELVSGNEVHTLSDRSGFVQTRLQFACYAKHHADAMQLARAIKNSGVTTLKGVTNGVDFRGVEIDEGIRCYSESPTDGSSEWRYIAEFDLMISYLE